MSGLWDNAGVPHKGWVCTNVTDLEPENESDYASCEMCGKEQIRYVHTMEHDEFPPLEVGCICAEKMSGDYVNPKRREQKLRNRAARKAKWLKRRWRRSAKGNSFINADGHNLVVFPNKFNPDKFSFGIDGKFSRRLYDSESAAKLAMFDEFWKILQAEEEDEDDYFDYVAFNLTVHIATGVSIKPSERLRHQAGICRFGDQSRIRPNSPE